jgi:hypothetical protein
MSDLVEGELIKVELEIRVPKAATEKQVKEWIHFSLLQNGSIGPENPLYNERCDSWWGPFGMSWKSTGMIGRREEFDRVKTDDGERYRVRYHRDRIGAILGQS